MKTRLAVMVALASAAILSLGACGGGPSTSGSTSGSTIPLLRGGAPIKYSTVDPYKTFGCNALFCAQFMEHLLTVDANGQLQPLLATSWRQTGPLTYVYQLRHGVDFWDGHEMTSEDVVYSLNYDRAPGSGVDFAFSSVASIEATDKYTVQVTLNKPDASWKWQLSYEGPIFEKRFQQAHKDTFGNPGTLLEATGPWKIDSFDPTRGIEMSANPHWWGGKVPIQHLSFRFFSDEKSEALAMRAGDLDIGFPIADYTTFKSVSGATVTSYPYNLLWLFSMNVKVAPWNDIHVRRAVAHALNRKDIIAATGGSATAVPAYAAIPELDLNSLGSRSEVASVVNSLPQYRYDVGKAKQELAQSAYPHGFSANLVIPAGQVIDQNGAQVIAAELKQIGIDLTLNSEPSTQFSTDLIDHKFAAIFTGNYAVPPDPAQFANYLFSSDHGHATAYNTANWTSPEVDQLIDQGLAAGSSSQRLDVYQQLLKKAATDEPYVPLFQENAFAATSKNFRLQSLSIWSGFIPWALNVKRVGGGQ